jgi:hypothetical protein
MHRTFLPAAILAIAPLALAGEPAANPTTITFASGGSVRLKLDKGAIEVVGTPEDKITVSWKSTDDDARVNVLLRQAGDKSATVAVEGPGNRVQYRVELPQQTDVVLSMNAGELRIQGLRGNLDAELLAGDLSVRVKDPNDYRLVRGSVTAGDISAKPWHVSTGGLWRSFEKEGGGKLSLKTHVLAGQITIKQD